jgi:hypothetical protein
LISGILGRTETTPNDATAISGYELLARITGLLSTTTAPVPTYQQTNTAINVTSGALVDILQMLGSPSESTNVIESVSSGASRLSNSG